MRVSDSSVGGEAGQFHTTRWTLVLASARDQSQTGRAALAALCQIYWYPLYAFARRRGYSPPDLSAETHRAHRLKRGGQCQFISLDLETAENRYRYEPADYLTAEKIFEARWALTLLEHAMTVVRQEYLARGKESVFDILRAFVGIAETKPVGSYEEAAKALGVGAGTVKTFIHRLRKRYLAVVREEVARTVSDPAEIEGEIQALCEALTAAEGRLKP
jgi:hypothetical protein